MLLIVHKNDRLRHLREKRTFFGKPRYAEVFFSAKCTDKPLFDVSEAMRQVEPLAWLEYW